MISRDDAQQRFSDHGRMGGWAVGSAMLYGADKQTLRVIFLPAI
jgi:hypothetical protein